MLRHWFSLKRDSMRAWRWHRFVQTAWLVPFFGFLCAVNNACLLLDWVFFPNFRKRLVMRPVFVVSLPRTGTTNLLHGLVEGNGGITAMALWESLLAPSILQKRLGRWFWCMASDAARRRWARWTDALLADLDAIHRTGMAQVEEDDLALMWSFSSAYLSFFFPESPVFRSLLRLDQAVPKARQKRIMKRYRRLVQRHLHGLHHAEEIRFVSKNPLMIPKLRALAEEFPDAQTVVIDRDPLQVFPSTEALFKQLLLLATDVPLSGEERNEVHRLLEDWRHHLQMNLVECPVLPCVVVRFEDLIRDRAGVLENLFLHFSVEGSASATLNEASTRHRSPAQYTPWSNAQLKEQLSEPWPTWPSSMFQWNAKMKSQSKS